jgi:pSer/pThr/pTyr-binding forkhead associated (FHA) protein
VRAYARIIAPDGTSWLLGPGDLIGRVHTAALVIDDARVSEAHALVSLRGGELKLLGLRGVFAVDGQPTSEVVLSDGLEIELAPGLPIVIEEVDLPDHLLALESDALPRQVLVGASSVIVSGSGSGVVVQLVGRYHDGAGAHLWSNGDVWRLRVRGEAARDLGPGDRFVVGGHEIRVVAVTIAGAGQAKTHVEGGLSSPLRIVAHFDSVHIHHLGREHEQPLVLDGISARIVSELVAIGGPAPWDVLAGEVWRDEDDRLLLRRKWDVSLARLRRKLRDGRVRPDLVRAGGTGHVELMLYAGDVVDDQT